MKSIFEKYVDEHSLQKEKTNLWGKILTVKLLWMYILIAFTSVALFFFVIPKELYYPNENWVQYVSSDYWKGATTLFQNNVPLFSIGVLVSIIPTALAVFTTIFAAFIHDEA
jgi:hypothetical protein